MSLKTQGKILRVLQEMQFQRVGGSRTINVDVRIIAATNKTLETEIKNETFREDLYYRLNVIPINVHSLKNRREDIPLLVETFIRESANENMWREKKLSDDAMEALCRYTWPGNVRELKNLVERLMIMVEKDVIDISDLPSMVAATAPEGQPPEHNQLFEIDNLKAAKKAFEKAFIHNKLEEQENNITKTAEAIGVARSYLHKKLKTTS